MSWWQFADRVGFTQRCEQEMPKMRASKVWILHYVERPNRDLWWPKRRRSHE